MLRHGWDDPRRDVLVVDFSKLFALLFPPKSPRGPTVIFKRLDADGNRRITVRWPASAPSGPARQRPCPAGVGVACDCPTRWGAVQSGERLAAVGQRPEKWKLSDLEVSLPSLVAAHRLHVQPVFSIY
jgi:hypothetical protein